MKKVSIISQIIEVEREIAMRQRVYPAQVRQGKMREAEAELLIERMRAVRDTLKFCQQNESDIRAFMAARGSGS